MSTFLFDKTIFGPVKSRRLGVSLGINLLPNDSKLCSFDCIYCECGWNPDATIVKAELPSRQQVYDALQSKLISMGEVNQLPDVITFAGNGEPTMHKQFSEIIDDTIILRNRYAPDARIAVLSNSTMLFKSSVVEALKKIDDNILKLDSAVDNTVDLMNCPVGRFDLETVIGQLSQFNGQVVIQTMFLRGVYNGKAFDNTTEEEVEAWINALTRIKPGRVMIYTIARDTPLKTLEKVSVEDLKTIASQVESRLAIAVEVSG